MSSFNFDSFKDPALARSLSQAINQVACSEALPATVKLMEVCGTHTMSIARNGLRALMPANIQLLSGPGCPVCVTANRDIDTLVALARLPEVTIATFGDMVRVPGSTTSLQQLAAQGARIQIVYSPLDAIAYAQDHPDEQVVFAGVGFETTTPLIAMAIKRAAALQLPNFSVLVANKNMPGALEAIVSDPQLKVDGLILPGHVSTIIGPEPYRFLARDYHIPGVITGFDPVDILQGIYQLLLQLVDGRAEIENAYPRAVMEQGNPVAVAAIEEVFDTCDASWRGLGLIPASGYVMRPAFAQFDARQRFAPEPEPTREHSGCCCGDVLRGIMAPPDCPLFAKACTPETPIGPCMVSSEGSCAAYYSART